MSSSDANMDAWTLLDEPKAAKEEAEKEEAEEEEEADKKEAEKEEVLNEEVAKKEVAKEDKEEVVKEEADEGLEDKPKGDPEILAKVEKTGMEEDIGQEPSKASSSESQEAKWKNEDEEQDKDVKVGVVNEDLHRVTEERPAELKQDERLEEVVPLTTSPTTDEVEEHTRERKGEEEKKQEQQERQGEEKEEKEESMLDQATSGVAPSLLSETEGRRHSVRWWPVSGVMVLLFYTVVVYYMSREWQTRIATAEWEKEFGALVAEKMQEMEEERRSLVNLTHDMNQEERQADIGAQGFWKEKLAFIGAIIALATTWCTREVCRVIERRRMGTADSMKEALEAALTHHYKAEPISVLGRHRFTHIFTGIKAARQHGQTLQSPPLCFPGMMYLGITFTLSLRVRDGVSLCVNILGTEKPAVETPGRRTREQVLDVLMRKCSLRFIPQGKDSGSEPRETMLHLASGNFQEMLREDELESGQWIRGDMLVAQAELIFGTW